MNISWAVHRVRPRFAIISAVIISAVLVMAGLLAAIIPVTSARAAGSAAAAWKGGTRPVIVLEHGAWADASSWDRVIAGLQRDGFTVYAPPNPLRGLSSDSAYLHDFLTQNAALAGKPVVLVGHSYGGAVITDAAVVDAEVKALVYVDAFIPDQGQSIAQLLAAMPGSCIANPQTAFNPVIAPDGVTDLYLQPGEFSGCFASGLPAGKAAVLSDGTQTLALRPGPQPARQSAD